MIAAYGKGFAKTKILDPKFHRHLIIVERRQAIGHYGEESSVTGEDVLESYEWQVNLWTRSRSIWNDERFEMFFLIEIRK